MCRAPLLILGAIAPLAGQARSAASGQSGYQDRFILANGARLYLADWGGSGPVLLFIPGFGNGAHIFDSLAPAFLDHFHVAALTPRGFPPSSAPDSGYTIVHLAADVRVVLDSLRASKAVLAGHSIAGAVITRFAEDYPSRLLAAVYLDGAYDFGESYRRSRATARADLPKPLDTTSARYRAWKERYPDHSALIQRDGRMWDIDSTDIARREALVAPLVTEVRSTPHEVWWVRAPALVVCATGSMDRSFGWFSPDSAPWRRTFDFVQRLLATKRGVCEDARRQLPRGRLLVLDAGHYVFLDQRDEVIRGMKAFLLSAVPHAITPFHTSNGRLR